jgi:hypothetical protein
LFEEKSENELLAAAGTKVGKASAGYTMVRMRLAVEIKNARSKLDALSRQLPTKSASDAN